MFGIFQADLPVGRLIWRVLLGALIIGFLTGQQFQFAGNFAEFTFETIALIGYVAVLFVMLRLIPDILVEEVAALHGLNRRRRDPFCARVKTDNNAKFARQLISAGSFWLALLLAYVLLEDIDVSVLQGPWASFGPFVQWVQGWLPAYQSVSAFGLVLLFVVDFISIPEKRIIETVLVTANDDVVSVSWRGPGGEQTFRPKSSWGETVQLLLNNDWRVIEISSLVEPKSALFSRQSVDTFSLFFGRRLTQ